MTFKFSKLYENVIVLSNHVRSIYTYLYLSMSSCVFILFKTFFQRSHMFNSTSSSMIISSSLSYQRSYNRNLDFHSLLFKVNVYLLILRLTRKTKTDQKVILVLKPLVMLAMVMADLQLFFFFYCCNQYLFPLLGQFHSSLQQC